MPFFEKASLRNPIQLQAIGNWRHVGTLRQGSQVYPVQGGPNQRGCIYLTGSDGKYTVVLGRSIDGASVFGLAANSYLMNEEQDGTAQYETFNGLGILPQKTSGPTFFSVNTWHFFDGNLWVFGQQGGPLAPAVMALPAGNFLTVEPNTAWINRTNDIPLGPRSGALPGFMVRAPNAGGVGIAKYYYLLENHDPFPDPLLGTTGVMTALASTATSTGFSFVSTTTPANNTGVKGYGVQNNGVVQMMAFSDGSTWKSLDSGVTWTSMTSALNFVSTTSSVDFIHCSAFGRWVACGVASFQSTIKYSDNNGTTWTVAKSFNTSTGIDSTLPKINLIERIDPEGRILLGLAGLAPVKLYISLNGGREWAFMTAINNPNYDIESNPNVAVPRPVEYGVPPVLPILVNDGSRILLYQGGLTGDEGVFVCDMLNLPVYWADGDNPSYWKP